MAELVYQTWERITGRPWGDAAKGGFTDGSYNANIALQKKLLGGWDPYATAAQAKPKAKPKAKAAAPTTPGPGPVPVDPGLAAQQWEALMALQKQIADDNARLLEEAQADARRLQEAQLSANPADFVAYQLYRRSLEEQGYTPISASESDEEIQELFGVALELNEGISAGTGQFGVDIPSTGSISRSELQAFSPTDIGILSSFLRGGVDTGEGDFQGINPEDFFVELEEGLIPVLPDQRTQYR